ncbi:MAG: hypothetical protein QOD41_3572, partial [Cryptosporangiaceae bacterium]|nr:hypothetical protein [Cryptosporangiaceae bacterium]
LVGVPDPAAGRECLDRLQVTARSRFAALALHIGGLAVDGGLLRILGCGCAEGGLPNLAEANGLAGESPRGAVPPLPRWLRRARRAVPASGPDSAVAGRPDEPGEPEWPGWQDDVRPLAGDEGILGCPVPVRPRAAPVPAAELFALNADLVAQFGAGQPRIGGS